MFVDKFGKSDNDCWISMSNVKCIIKLSILNVALPMDAMMRAFVFIKYEYMPVLYNCNNFWIKYQHKKFISFNTPIKNKQIGELGYF